MRNLIRTQRFLIFIFSCFCNVCFAEEFNIKYSTNYLMPAYIHFNNNGKQYKVEAKINIPFYNIKFSAKGYEHNQRFHLLSYRDNRNGKDYAMAELDSNTIQYGVIKKGVSKEALTLPTFDFFSLAFQLSYYDKLPKSFQTTNGKRLYPIENVQLAKTQKTIQVKGKNIEEITYQFKTGKKYITVKKWLGEKFPRYLAYDQGGEHYELSFDHFIH